jgi:hypothetical protein
MDVVLTPDYLAKLRSDIVRCGKQLETPVPVHAASFDRGLMAELGQNLSRALHDAQEKSRELVAQHQREFPASPLFSCCSLLGPLDQSRREVSITQVLGWLLDPSADHGFHGLLLRAFLSSLGEKEEAASAILKAPDADISICTEFAITAANRADIVIAWHDYAVVIEAKVDAAEGRNQTERYTTDFGSEFSVCSYYFLTPQGTEASDGMFKVMRYLHVAKHMIKALPQGRSAEGFHYARYFLAGVLSDLCGIQTSPRTEVILRSNSFDLETLLDGSTNG